MKVRSPIRGCPRYWPRLRGGGSAQPQVDRTVLPMAEPKRPVYTEIDARKVKMPPPLRGQGAGRCARTWSSC